MKSNFRDALVLQISFPSSRSLAETLALAGRIIAQAEGCEVKACTIGASQVAAEHLQENNKAIQLAKLSWSN
jgi:hypothetical protein